ncbi:MAG: hypothetical protein NUV92_02055 [Ignavibacteria bacterium]|jgi:hypothetical protein|nr:hypothetical protein [Ignavibacteria bacterium]MDH7527017.1 hypothetical protein [Ignavibacteria bacterium]
MSKIYKLLFAINTIFIFSLLNFSCDAPHINPLDPQNPSKKSYSIEGYVYSYSLPRISIPNALVIWQNENKATLTNSNGYFKIDVSNLKDGWLKVIINGYKQDSVFVVWNSTKFYKEFFLNQIPVIDSIEFYSVLLNQYPNLQSTTLNIRVKISDRDNDIDSVLIENPLTKSKFSLIYNSQSRFYERTFDELDFNVDDFSEIIGLKFNIYVKDFSEDIFKVGEEKLNRIIKNEIILETPLNNDTVSSKPYLQWRRFNPGFKFSYSVEILNDEFPPRTIWSKDNISMEETGVQVDANLPAGNYFWVVWCVDQFLNRARSKPGSFVVK